jgi:hypothetical protein
MDWYVPAAHALQEIIRDELLLEPYDVDAYDA